MITRTAWILVGVLLWGIPASIITALIVSIYQTRNVEEGYLFVFDAFVTNVYILLPVFGIIGIALGLIMFRIGQIPKK